MGGTGSGSWSGWRAKSAAVEECKKLDVRFLQKRGFLRPGTEFSMHWSDWRGNPSCVVNIAVKRNCVSLSCRFRSTSETEWVLVDQDVALTHTPCHFGGTRPWLLCPRCGRRVAILYCVGKYFLCRHCHNLSYTSTREDQQARCRRRAEKIRSRLGATGSFMRVIEEKPKGMHWKTFLRLKQKVSQLERGAFMLCYRRLIGRGVLPRDHFLELLDGIVGK